ncbi:MAG: hypothetical protein JRJ59_09215 [Deltaproteobacteria bacterium]|nr:hypothetical protein [Deltaproteobacteria bacterium]
MTREDAGHYAAKHKDNRELNPALAEAVQKRAVKTEMACAVAFQTAEETGNSPAEVGRTLDLLEIKIVKCQLGLFGFEPQSGKVKPAEQISAELKEALLSGLKEGRVPCAECWAIAARLNLTKMAVARACDKLGLKIGHCQLGVF